MRLHTQWRCLRRDVPLRSWIILYFWKWNCVIWWILLGTNLEQMMSKKRQVFGPDWSKFCILREILDRILLKSLKISPSIELNLLILTELFVKVYVKKMLTMWDDYIGHPPLSNIKKKKKKKTRPDRYNAKMVYSEWRLTGRVHTANCVGQNLSTFAELWFKYQQSKLFVGQFDPTMDKT